MKKLNIDLLLEIKYSNSLIYLESEEEFNHIRDTMQKYIGLPKSSYFFKNKKACYKGPHLYCPSKSSYSPDSSKDYKGIYRGDYTIYYYKVSNRLIKII